MPHEDQFAYVLSYTDDLAVLTLSQTLIDSDFHRALMRDMVSMFPGRRVLVYLRKELPEPAHPEVPVEAE